MGSATRTTAAGIAVAGAVGLGLLAVPAGAGAAPVLPSVTPEELVASVLEADPDAFSGRVELDNALGLPAVEGVPAGTSEVRIWSDGEDGGRVQVPSDSGERTLVTDGTTFWAWDSAERTVVTGEKGERPAEAAPSDVAADPAAAATEAIRVLQTSSDVAVDGTSEVAGRPAYELVLTPDPTERTLLREVRVAVDAEQRIPLRLTVLAQGSTDPVFQVGFTELEFAAQDAELFTFTPPPGATVEQAERPEGAERERPEFEGAAPQVVGDGWDTVVVATAPAGEAPQGPEGEDALGQVAALGTPVSGSWGSGTLITTAVGSAIVTDDGRVAAGAVPEQVLTEALSR
jgi:outer membrane lipoprotein-sorting protein